MSSEFLLGILGLSRVERMTVTSVCSLTRSRPRGYSVLTAERSAEAHIMLVDADDGAARQSWEASPLRRKGKPALLISREFDALRTQPYMLPRANFAARLVKILDQITIHEFKFLPELIVGDGATAMTNLPQPIAQTGSHRQVARALVIDDSMVVLTKMRTLLGLHAIETDIAHDAEHGMELMRLGRYDIVFLDIELPGIDGYAACRKMKTMQADAPPIVMLTSRDSTFDKIRGVMAGCSRYLTKPIAADSLGKVLEEFLPRRAART
jgi:two-component system cell cycle response regulator